MSAGRQFAIGAFGFFDARRRCAEHECNTRAAIFRDGRSCAIDETVLMQRDPRQSVVAAVPCGERAAATAILQCRRRVRSSSPAVCAPKSLAAQSARSRRQRAHERTHAAASGAGRGVSGNGERCRARRQAIWQRDSWRASIVNLSARSTCILGLARSDNILVRSARMHIDGRVARRCRWRLFARSAGSTLRRVRTR